MSSKCCWESRTFCSWMRRSRRWRRSSIWSRELSRSRSSRALLMCWAWSSGWSVWVFWAVWMAETAWTRVSAARDSMISARRRLELADVVRGGGVGAAHFLADLSVGESLASEVVCLDVVGSLCEVHFLWSFQLETFCSVVRLYGRAFFSAGAGVLIGRQAVLALLLGMR